MKASPLTAFSKPAICRFLIYVSLYVDGVIYNKNRMLEFFKKVYGGEM